MVKTRTKPRKAKAASGPQPLYVLSDSTGNLARHMLTSFLTQFPAGMFHVHHKPFVGEAGRWSEALSSISARPGIVLHAVVSEDLKDQISHGCEELNVPCCDMTGTIVEFLANAARVRPICDQQQLHKVDHVYCDRINAMSFTLEHDDGLGLDSLNCADIVLAGVSRTGKTPTSVYLAMQGYRVANVSLAQEAPVPRQLTELSPGKIVGLMIDPGHLAEIRGRRQAAWNMVPTRYSDARRVHEEIDWSRGVFTRLRCPILDVTDQAIEETAARVLDMLRLTEPPQHADEGLS